ncbi:MAG: phosphoribosylanthranilate isomerase [Spirosomataceae bacterium]
MRDSDNIRELLELQPDYMGFIFYEKSPRFVADELDEQLLKSFPRTTKKVGVFVNATIDTILRNVKRYNLDFVQLHGDETPDFCKSLQFKGVNIIKAFSVDENFNFNKLNNYKPVCDYFLFDAKGQNRGGNGTTFDWSVLKRYDNEKPFFLAGGIGPDHAEQLTSLTGLRIHAVDINSLFEISPAQKDIKRIQAFSEVLKPQEAEA